MNYDFPNRYIAHWYFTRSSAFNPIFSWAKKEQKSRDPSSQRLNEKKFHSTHVVVSIIKLTELLNWNIWLKSKSESHVRFFSFNFFSPNPFFSDFLTFSTFNKIYCFLASWTFLATSWTSAKSIHSDYDAMHYFLQRTFWYARVVTSHHVANIKDFCSKTINSRSDQVKWNFIATCNTRLVSWFWSIVWWLSFTRFLIFCFHLIRILASLFEQHYGIRKKESMKINFNRA